jgi:hypothetical protein
MPNLAAPILELGGPTMLGGASRVTAVGSLRRAYKAVGTRVFRLTGEPDGRWR